ncbi:uncharacterized protein N7483_011090 [Penicillium malachiteum]|uniref:uncharacterized protein n=1 Tax=Penicillium malachiteum TaxID=1324776 RepID=UPI0025480D9D|nr:uncharacterized protein N7483_011090 [Penicillium malachiteum]KAJ5713909.1 hypothetical protein N7483_011090 [Penicillium malachiteum]
MAPLSTHRVSKIDTSGETQLSQLAEMDPAERRRIQNRINQRASRQRRALKSGKGATNQPSRWVIYTGEAQEAQKPEGPVASSSPVLQLETPPPTPPEEISLIDKDGRISFEAIKSWNTSKFDLVCQLERKVASAAALKLDYIHLLAPVAHLNVISALLNNASIMGMSIELLEEDIASLFNIDGPMELILPPSLEPSSTQKKIIHHPWIDLIPMASFRDMLLKNMDRYDEDEFCGDLHGQIGVSDGIGLIVWGESWDPNAYEISESVFRKWYWILKECPEILKTTNYWRRVRGEKPLRFDQAASSTGFVHPEEVQE